VGRAVGDLEADHVSREVDFDLSVHHAEFLFLSFSSVWLGGAGGGRCCFTRCVVMQANIQQAVIIRGDWASSFSSPSDNQNPSFSDLLAASDSVYYEEGGAE